MRDAPSDSNEHERNRMQTERIREIIGRFDTAGTVADLRAVGNGWINDTYRVMTVSDETPDYILQRINHHVFKDVELLQRNIERVTSHIRRKLAAAGADDLDRRVLRIARMLAMPVTLGILAGALAAPAGVLGLFKHDPAVVETGSR